MKSIKVTVSPAGDVTIEAVGFKGASCEKATAALEQALGNKSGDKAILPDRYLPEIQTTKAAQ